MYTLEFNQSDLDANRQGYLSDAQRKRLESDVDMLKRQGKYMVWFFCAMIIVMGVLGFAIEYNNANEDLNAMFSPANRVGFAIAGTIFTAILLLVVAWNWWSTYRYSQGRFRSVEGKVHVVNALMRMRGSSIELPVYGLEVRRGWFSKLTFRFQDDKPLRYFEDGQRYRVYYLPYSIPQALSAERLSDTQ